MKSKLTEFGSKLTRPRDLEQIYSRKTWLISAPTVIPQSRVGMPRREYGFVLLWYDWRISFGLANITDTI